MTDRETTRKKYIVSLENRTPDQIAEEEALYVEIKRLEHNERRFTKERDELLRTIAGIESGLPDIIEDDPPRDLTSDIKKKNKRGSMAMDIDSPSTPSMPISAPIIKRPQSAKNAALGIVVLVLKIPELIRALYLKMLPTVLFVRTHQPPSLSPKPHTSRPISVPSSCPSPKRQSRPKSRRRSQSLASRILGSSCPLVTILPNLNRF